MLNIFFFNEMQESKHEKSTTHLLLNYIMINHIMNHIMNKYLSLS